MCDRLAPIGRFTGGCGLDHGLHWSMMGAQGLPETPLGSQPEALICIYEQSTPSFWLQDFRCSFWASAVNSFRHHPPNLEID